MINRASKHKGLMVFRNISEDASSVSNENSNKSFSKFILPTLEENIDIRKQKIISPLKKVKSNQISARYLKDHVKFKNTAEFFLNVMHGTIQSQYCLIFIFRES